MKKNSEKVVLVVEDEVPLLDAIRMKLEKADFQVVTARAVNQAKNHLLDIERVDAVWLDHYLLGKESGLDFVAWCKKESAACKRIPIFVVSNTASADKLRTYLKLGVSKYYVKSDIRLEEIVNDMIHELNKQK